jgi:hypothetical protein
MIITKFDLFCEARLSDLVNIRGEGDFAKNLKSIKDREFDPTKNLIKFITLKERVNKNKIQFSINWNNSATHNLIQRIDNRTSFKSVEEFNQYFKVEFNKIFPKMIGKEIYVSGRYSLYSKEYNFSTIMNFDIEEYADGIYEVDIITILTGKKGNNIVKFIDIL